jgi:hypothetical protein
MLTRSRVYITSVFTLGMHESLGVHHSEKIESLVINNLDQIVEYLSSKSNVRVDIILDNSGFELFVDLIFADFLIQSGIADTVVFHAKAYPYFVSDVVLSITYSFRHCMTLVLLFPRSKA